MEFSDSEEEAYDVWPGCVLTATGAHFSGRYDMEYTLPLSLATFLQKSTEDIMTYYEIEHGLLNYIKRNRGIDNNVILYDEDVWVALQLDKSYCLKIYKIPKILDTLLTRVFKPPPRPIIYWGSYIEDLEATAPEQPQPIPPPNSDSSRELRPGNSQSA